RWVRALFSSADKPRRNPGGGIILRTTGAVVESIYSVLVVGSKVFFWLREDLYSILSKWDIYLLFSAGIIPEPDFNIDEVIDISWDSCGSLEEF
ncbi:MAG TPA: hypothetical protein P5280_18395, partial [Cyclobacteriaceae bacterium]|nr:hypothetical protein [Cyclobacteriaceae bacterium]